MASVTISAEAQRQFLKLPLPIQYRVRQVFARLALWPAISGAKPLRGDLKNNFRIRTGDYRVLFAVTPDHLAVRVWRIGYLGDIYDQ